MAVKVLPEAFALDPDRLARFKREAPCVAQSPEAAGKPVDKRADIWSFGVVFLEMLIGRPLFDGETISHTLADVLRPPIDFEALPRETPAVIRDLLQRCLDRDVHNRLRDIGEARIQIQKYPSNPASASGATAAVATLSPPHARLLLPWAVAAVFAAAAIDLGLLYYPRKLEAA